VAIVSVRGSLALIRRCGCVRSGRPAEFLDRAEADAVGLSEGAVDGASFGDEDFGKVLTQERLKEKD
jgi:hypothetical protein